jgi:hypothetical protein
MKLGPRQLELLVEAAAEVTMACPWVWIEGYQRRPVRSLADKGLLGCTGDVFGIMPAGCLELRKHDRQLARKAVAGLRREAAAGSVMPWHV